MRVNRSVTIYAIFLPKPLRFDETTPSCSKCCKSLKKGRGDFKVKGMVTLVNRHALHCHPLHLTREIYVITKNRQEK